MPPASLTLIRHAEGIHNQTSDYTLHDPPLSPAGTSQAQTLAAQLRSLQPLTHIFASPMRRTLQTALLALHPHLEADPSLRIIALPELQETSGLPCDVGSGIGALKAEFGVQPVDLGRLREGWEEKRGIFRPTTGETARRAEVARRVLSEIEGGRVVVVAHGGLLHYLTEDWEGSGDGHGTGWRNGEARTYVFDGSSAAARERAAIKESEESIARRFLGGQYVPLTAQEQHDLRVRTERAWARDGYIDLSEEENSTEGNKAEILNQMPSFNH